MIKVRIIREVLRHSGRQLKNHIGPWTYQFTQAFTHGRREKTHNVVIQNTHSGRVDFDKLHFYVDGDKVDTEKVLAC